MGNQQRKRFRRGFLAIEDWLGGLDGRTIAGLAMLLMGLSVAMYPNFSAVSALASLGISPKVTALLLVSGGGVVLRWPNSRWYTLCLIPLALYFAGVVYHYGAVVPESSATPIVVVGALMLYAVVAGVRNGRVG